MDTCSTTQMAQILVKHWRYRGISRTKLIWTPIGRIGMGKTIRGSSCWTWMGKTTKLSMSICSLRTGFFIGLCGWQKWLERSRVWLPCGRNSWKLWSWRTNLVSWPLCILGCTRRECKPIDIIIGEFSKVFESRISAGSTGQIPGWEKPHAKTVAWSYDMEGHAGKCAGRYCDLANKTVAQLYKVASLCLDDHQFKQEELESLGELSQVCSQTVIKCL